MSGPSGEQCGRCYYCVDVGAVDEYYGICRRYPAPVKERHRHDDRAVWTSIGDWCGEFKLHPKMQRHLWKAMIGKDYDSDVEAAE